MYRHLYLLHLNKSDLDVVHHCLRYVLSRVSASRFPWKKDKDVSVVFHEDDLKFLDLSLTLLLSLRNSISEVPFTPSPKEES